MFNIKNYSKTGWNITIDNPLKGLSAGNYTLSTVNKYITANKGMTIYFSDIVNGSMNDKIGEVFVSYEFGNTQMSNTKSITQEQINANYMIIGPQDNLCTQEILENMGIMIEKGSTSTNFVEHKEQVLPLTLGNIELCKIGDYQDYFYKESNKWYLHKEIKKILLNGTEYWLISNNVFYLTSISDYINSSGKICLSDKYTAINNTNAGTSAITQNNSICFFNTNTNPRLYIRDERFNNVNDFETELSENNVKVYYPTVTPTDTEITDTTLISQLEAINNALSYEEQTNISGSSDGSNPIFTVQTYKDLNKELNNKVDKVQGKELSSNDFTDTLKEKLEGLENYDDTEIKADISGKQDKTDNNLTTINKAIVGAINEVDSIAKGANQALSYGNYSTMITAFNSLANDIYNIGQNIMIITLEVPDLWISGIESTSSTYTYVDDETFVNSLATDGYVQVGYYKLSALETQKVNLDDYVTKTENKNKADIINNELTGSTIYFTDGINNSPVNKLIVNIEPVQEGSGTPTPNNVRNIIGWNAAIINHSGADTQNPNVLNVSWQNEAGIVYGGTLNVATGLLTVTKALVELAVEDMNNTETYPGWKNTGIESIIGVGINQKFTSILNIGDTFSANTTSGTGTIFLPRSAYGLTQEQWKEQYPNLTIQIIAEYQNPETYQLTPHEIRTLLGINNFWANAGDVTVNYKADTKLYIDSKFQSLEDRLSLLEG